MKKKNDLEMKEQNKLAVLKGWFWFVLETLPIWLFVLLLFIPTDFLSNTILDISNVDTVYAEDILILGYDDPFGIANIGLNNLINYYSMSVNGSNVFSVLSEGFFQFFQFNPINQLFYDLFNVLNIPTSIDSPYYILLVVLSWYCFVDLFHIFVDFVLLLPNIVKNCMYKIGGC